VPSVSPRRVALAVAATIALAVVAGCGGDDGSDGGSQAYQPEASTTMSTESISKAQFVRRVNGLCREAWAEVSGNWHDYTRTQDPKLSERERFEDGIQLSLLAGIDYHIFDEIRQLGAPIGEAEAIEEMIGPFQVAVELGWKKRWTGRSMHDVPPQFAEYNRHARSHGLDDCLVDMAHLRPMETLGRHTGAT
jgi:hypothetical protein